MWDIPSNETSATSGTLQHLYKLDLWLVLYQYMLVKSRTSVVLVLVHVSMTWVSLYQYMLVWPDSVVQVYVSLSLTSIVLVLVHVSMAWLVLY